MQAISLQRQWTRRQALILVTLCLAAGITGGWLVRGLQKAPAASLAQSQAFSSAAAPASPASPSPSPASLKEMADTQAAPLLAKLSADPRNPDTLAAIANLYYDAQQYSVAVDYYNRTLQLRPSDA